MTHYIATVEVRLPGAIGKFESKRYRVSEASEEAGHAKAFELAQADGYETRGISLFAMDKDDGCPMCGGKPIDLHCVCCDDMEDA